MAWRRNLVVMAVLATGAMAGCDKTPPVALGELGTVPPFALTDQAGQAVTAAGLQGKVWAANFMFTSCPTACPPLAKATAQLQGRIQAWDAGQGRAQIVTISVDPMTDTPEVLRSWAAKYGADPAIWRQLTGDYDAMEKLVVNGFYQPIVRSDRAAGLAAAPTAATPLDTAHSLQFVLVDQRGRMRGLFGKDDEALGQLDAAMRWLAEHPGL